MGAALSPTDPIVAAAIVGREEVPVRVRRLLNVESGFNDGLALPAVTILLSSAGGPAVRLGQTIEQLGLGIAIGVAVPITVITALESRYFAATGIYKRLGEIGVGLLVYALASKTHANEFLAAFVAGIVTSTRSPEVQRAFIEFGETMGELVKLAAVLLFGSLLTTEFFLSLPVLGYVFVIAALLFVRPAALAPALAGTGLSKRECASIVWFGPKGFASLLFGFIILNSRVRESEHMFAFIGLVVVASILAHSSTDVIIAPHSGIEVTGHYRTTPPGDAHLITGPAAYVSLHDIYR